MAYALATRAASLCASGLAMIGLATIALMATYTIELVEPATSPAAIDVVRPPEPPPQAVEPPRRMPVSTETMDISLLPQPDSSAIADPQWPSLDYAPPPGPVEITAPHWLQRPRDLSRYYPSRALARGVEGEVLLDCRVSTGGALDCSIIAESPQGWGFGAAALRISRDHRMAPATSAGAVVEGRYRMRVPFEIPT